MAIILRISSCKADGSTLYREESVSFPYAQCSTLPELAEKIKGWNRQNYLASREKDAPFVREVWRLRRHNFNRRLERKI